MPNQRHIDGLRALSLVRGVNLPWSEEIKQEQQQKQTETTKHFIVTRFFCPLSFDTYMSSSGVFDRFLFLTKTLVYQSTFSGNAYLIMFRVSLIYYPLVRSYIYLLCVYLFIYSCDIQWRIRSGMTALRKSHTT